ncbi:MAG: nucleotide sugar dehydrogenase [Syntrophales bacterium]
MTANNESFSCAPDGEEFPLPGPADYAGEFKRLWKLAARHRKEGREIVVVMGVGFVGAVMAGVIADSVRKRGINGDILGNRGINGDILGKREINGDILGKRGINGDILGNREAIDKVSPFIGHPTKFVIGMQRPSPRSYWKIPYLNRGLAPVEAEDPEVARLIARCVNEKKTLTASFTYDALALADVVVVDVQCDYFKEELGNCRAGHAEIAALEESLKIIGEKIQPHCLVLIETTVPPGATEYVAYPILKKAFERRFSSQSPGGETGGHDPISQNSGSCPEPLLAHSYERVMPGRQYVASIRDFWRVCSGINDASRERVRKFLSEVLNVEEFPLTVLDRPIESETCKIVENSYRATILAFLNEWSLFAERNGVDLLKVIDAIKVRPTHSNMIFPGPGIGGYCLPKDGGLGVWAYNKLMGFEDDIFKMTPLAIDINDTRSLHAAELVRDALRNMGRIVAASRVVILGVSYREDVGDTRYSGSEALARKLAEMGAELGVHDPYVKRWWELEKQESYPAPGHSLARFFRNQESLAALRIEPDIATALKGADAVVFAVRHQVYLKLTPDEVFKMTGRPVAIIDCFGILDDAAIRRYFELGCEVKGLGRGHVKRLKDQVRGSGLKI